MRERVCKNCGGREYKVVGQNMVRCKFCGTLYVDEHSSKEEEVLNIGAYEILRSMDFEQAEYEFDRILEMFPLSFEAHFGKALARNRIVIYKKGQSKRPRFFDGIVSISEDENYLRALKLAPAEMNYEATAKRIDRILGQYEQTYLKEKYDCVICAPEEDENATLLAQNLQNAGKSVYKFPQRDKEEQTFRAIETAKALVLFVSENGVTEFKHVCDRYLYFIQKRKKTRSSVIAVLNQSSRLPRDLSFCQRVDEKEENFMHNLVTLVKKEIENSVNEMVKIETVKLEKVEPRKKKYVDIESVSPVDVGHYQVENVSVSDEGKIKWIFLSLKNGDFQTAKDLVEKALANDPYNSELLFAQLMVEKRIKTREDFFASINNFGDKEKIDNILRYSNREFAISFVDDWEKLIVSMHDGELFAKYLTYLASFKTPHRDDFIKSAEELAVESMDENLIESVLQCFDKSEVDRFIEFYFLLAQKSDDQKYYQKVLELDAGHVQSNCAIFFTNLKTTEQKLTFRDKEVLEGVLKYFDDEKREQLVGMVVDLVVDVAFFDLNEAQAQLDFYLSYISSDKGISNLAWKIAQKMQQMKFFKVAEKYISLAISKDKENVEMFWDLILIKAHCRSDNELMISDVKVMQMPEWETLIELGDDAQNEHYAGIVSKANLFKGEKTPFVPDLMDKKQIAQTLKEFLLRNDQILLEAEKEGTTKGGVRYFKAQFQPFEKYIKDIDKAETYEEYVKIVEHVNERLEALDLTLDASLSTLKISGVSSGMDKIHLENEVVKQKVEKVVQNQQRKQILKRALLVFLEIFPLVFTTFLFVLMIFAPKEVYLSFSQNFLIWAMIFSVVVALLNGTYYLIKKRKLVLKMKILLLSLFTIGVLNLLLFATGFYFSPKKIEIESAKELQVLLKNAYYGDFVLEKDINMKGKAIQSKNFYGTFDGKGHTISNVTFADGGLFKRNDGVVKNLNIELSQKTYKDSLFGTIAKRNSGKIENCTVSGTLIFIENHDAVIGGIVGENVGGEISNCTCTLIIQIESGKNDVTFGGIVGKILNGKDKSKFSRNVANVDANVTLSDSMHFEFGGIAGIVEKVSGTLTQNVSTVNLQMSGTSQDILVGGLFGQLRTSISDSHATISIDTDENLTEGFVGGLVGRFNNTTSTNGILHCYSDIQNLATKLKFGALVGRLTGRVNSCFTTSDLELCAEISQSYSGMPGCEKGLKRYVPSLGFDEKIWDLAGFPPKLLWERP